MISMISNVMLLEEEVWFPRSVNSKWPAIILAERRTVRVPGRITLLIVSIRTINGISNLGVLSGTKWANMWFMLLNQPNIMKASHSGPAKDKAKTKCLELVKMYGNRPKKLFKAINRRIVINIKVLPKEYSPNKILNSLWRIFINILNVVINRLFNSQSLLGIMKNNRSDLIQL